MVFPFLAHARFIPAPEPLLWLFPSAWNAPGHEMMPVSAPCPLLTEAFAATQAEVLTDPCLGTVSLMLSLVSVATCDFLLSFFVYLCLPSLLKVNTAIAGLSWSPLDFQCSEQCWLN